MGRWGLTAVLLDTHAWAWSLTDDNRLSRTAANAIIQSDLVLVSPISLFEIAQKVRLGKWLEMAPFFDQLLALLENQGGTVSRLDAPICIAAGKMSWSHRDPFDRLLAATTLAYNVPIISADTIFDTVTRRIW